jgi:Family of unknown function (DUF5946)
MTDNLEPCVGCGAILPVSDGPVHRYMTSSPACWAVFNALQNPELPLVQHPGVPTSAQAINSVAVHLMTLHGILEKKFKPDQAMWLRQRPGRPGSIDRHSRFHWLTPPSFANCLTVADVAAGETLHERSRLVEAWVKDVWKVWSELHSDQIATWFEKFMINERF